MEISACLDAKFWEKSFMSPSQDERCVWYTTIAMGVAHWLYITPACDTPLLKNFAISQYNQAISELVQYTNRVQGEPSNQSVVLLCCFLFVLLESLKGNYSEAIRHLDSGSRIITATPTNELSADEEVKQLAAMFHAISSQVTLFSDDYLLPDLTNHMASMKKYKHPAPKLRDLDEAEDVLNSFDDTLAYITRDIAQDWEDDSSDCNKQWQILSQQVEAWRVDFESLIKYTTIGGCSFQTRKRILNLKLQHRLWELLIDEENSACSEQAEPSQDDKKLTPAECNHLLDDIERLWGSSPQPEFGLKTDLITAIYQLYVFCPDTFVRRRIISILRSKKRREIVWDSFELAEFLESDLLYREMGIQESFWPNIGPSPDDDALLVFRPHSPVTPPSK
jgi:hypothetical protein